MQPAFNVDDWCGERSAKNASEHAALFGNREMLGGGGQRGKPPPKERDTKHLVPVPNAVSEKEPDNADDSGDTENLESFACLRIHGAKRANARDEARRARGVENGT